MIVYLIALAAVLFYTTQLPIRFAFTIKLGDGKPGDGNLLRAGVGLFQARYILEKQFTIDRARMLVSMGKLRSETNWAAYGPAIRAAEHFFKHARFEDTRLSIKLGTGNAAKTALLCGTLGSLVNALNAAGKVCISGRVSPDFERPGLALSTGGMVQVRLGHIMSAVFVWTYNMVWERMVNKHGKTSN